MERYGFKISNLFDFISPEKILGLGKDYVEDAETASVVAYEKHWNPSALVTIIQNVVCDSLYDGEDIIEGFLCKSTGKCDAVFFLKEKQFPEETPTHAAFRSDVVQALKKVSRFTDSLDGVEIPLVTFIKVTNVL